MYIFKNEQSCLKRIICLQKIIPSLPARLDQAGTGQRWTAVLHCLARASVKLLSTLVHVITGVGGINPLL